MNNTLKQAKTLIAQAKIDVYGRMIVDYFNGHIDQYQLELYYHDTLLPAIAEARELDTDPQDRLPLLG